MNFIIRYASPDLALNRILVSFASMRRWTGSSGLRSGPFSYLLSTSDTRAVWFTSKYHISFYFFVIYISLRSFFDRSTLYYDRSFLDKRRWTMKTAENFQHFWRFLRYLWQLLRNDILRKLLLHDKRIFARFHSKSIPIEWTIKLQKIFSDIDTCRKFKWGTKEIVVFKRTEINTEVFHEVLHQLFMYWKFWIKWSN